MITRDLHHANQTCLLLLSMLLSQAATAYSKSLTSGTKQLGGGGSGEGEITLRWDKE